MSPVFKGDVAHAPIRGEWLVAAAVGTLSKLVVVDTCDRELHNESVEAAQPQRFVGTEEDVVLLLVDPATGVHRTQSA